MTDEKQPVLEENPAVFRLHKGMRVVFLDGEVVDVPAGETTYSRCCVRAIMHRYHQGAATHKQLTVDDMATREMERAN